MLHIGDEDSVRQSNLDNDKDIVVLAHGWNGDGRNSMNRKLTEGKLLFFKLLIIYANKISCLVTRTLITEESLYEQYRIPCSDFFLSSIQESIVNYFRFNNYN